MALASKFPLLDYNRAKVRAYVRSKDTQAAMHAMNALKESIYDISVGASQVFEGHDHATGGGTVFCRGGVVSFDGGTTGLYSFTPTEAGQRLTLVSASGSLDPTLGNYRTSPGLERGALAKAHIVYAAKNSSFKIEIVEALTNVKSPRSVTLELPATYHASEDKVTSTVEFALPIVGGELNSHAIFVTNDTYNEDNQPEFEIFRIGFAEVAGFTTIRRFRDIRSVIKGSPSGGDVYRWFSDLNDKLADDEEWGDTELWFRLFSQNNALFESIADSSVSPAKSQKIKGHDHAPSSISGYQGGRVVARNTVHVAGKGESATFTCTVTSAGTYVVADSGNTAKFQRSGNGEPMFQFEVTEGLNSSGSPPSSTPYLTARVFLRWLDSSANVSLRFHNKTLSQYSAVTTQAATQTSPVYNRFDLEIDKIPCQGGVNTLDLEITSDKAGGSNVEVIVEKVVIQEVPGVGAVVSSSGNVPLGGVR